MTPFVACDECSAMDCVCEEVEDQPVKEPEQKKINIASGEDVDWTLQTR
jgi:hypothetical protein